MMILILISVSSEQFERGESRPQTAVLALKRLIYFATFARVAELVDARDLGSRAVRRASSSLAFRTRLRSEEHTSEPQSLMRISYAVICLNKKHSETRCIDKTIIRTYKPITQLLHLTYVNN